MNNETLPIDAAAPEAPAAPANQNAVKTGLYTRDAYIRPGEEAAFQQVIDKIFTDLDPQGAMEQVFASEIVTATWRLRRCGLVEGNIACQTYTDPMEDEAFEKKQRSVDRARAAAHNIIRRSLAELRKLQTERATRRELEITYEESVLVDTQKVARQIEAATVRQERMHKRVEKARSESLDNMLREIAEGPLPMPRVRPTAPAPAEPTEQAA